jgi:hypothetical protein
VLRENTLARVRGPAITPVPAAAMIQGSVTVPARLGVGMSPGWRMHAVPGRADNSRLGCVRQFGGNLD